jgi:serine/threonine protein kinase
MRRLSDPTLDHLREVADWPNLDATRYEVLQLLARGGMGTVYLARDRELERRVALKVLSAPDSGPEAATRMIKEARIIAQLEHPGIVPVHDVGTLADGRVFYAMKLVDGSRLDHLVHDGRPVPELLRIFERICEPVAFAHAHGVIHRDLKPENVMVGAFGEVLVMDWGVAKLLHEPVLETGSGAPVRPPSDGRTAHGTILGTPGYMAPEQARGEASGIDERADVYALGAILSFLLSARAPSPPEGLGTSRNTLTQPTGAAAALPLVTPRRPNVVVPRPLEAIRRRALAPEREARYASVKELAADVSSFLAGGPVKAYPEGPLERTRRFARTYRTPILLILAYILMRSLLIAFGRT